MFGLEGPDGAAWLDGSGWLDGLGGGLSEVCPVVADEEFGGLWWALGSFESLEEGIVMLASLSGRG